MKIGRGIGEAISDASMWLARNTDAGKKDFSADVFVATGGPIAWIAVLAGCGLAAPTAAERDLAQVVANAEKRGMRTFKACSSWASEYDSREAAEKEARAGLLKLFCGGTGGTGQIKASTDSGNLGTTCSSSWGSTNCCSVAAARKEDVSCE